MMNHAALLVFILGFCGANGLKLLRVTTDFGVYDGAFSTSESGVPYYRFRGIRYAMPPEHYQRFDEALPYNIRVPGIIEFDNYAPDCMAFDNFNFTTNYDSPSQSRTYRVIGAEDCLFLNVHTASIDRKVPVIFFVHGGGFGFGAPSHYDADYIMNRDVVYVNIAYRLGPLGFLSTGDNIVPGNAGLKDQLLALQWVNKNIEFFGGDKNRITITGIGAGGVSVHYMYLSPLTDGLFQRGFTHSGSALCPWALFGDIPQKTRKLAYLLGCDISSTDKMVGCLRNLEAYAIVDAMAQFKVFLFNPFTIFGPVVDSYSPKPYLPNTPLALLQQKKFKQLPFITGVTAEDGLYPSSEYIFNKKRMLDVIQRWNDYLPSILFYDGKKCGRNTAKLIQSWLLKLRNYYSISFPSAFLQIITFWLYTESALLSTSLMAQGNPAPIRMFYFRYRGAYTTSDVLSNNYENNGGLVGHADDSAYIYYLHGMELRNDHRDKAMSDEMLNLLTTFAENATVPFSFKMWETEKGVPDTHRYLDISEPNFYTSERQKIFFSHFMQTNLADCALSNN